MSTSLRVKLTIIAFALVGTTQSRADDRQTDKLDARHALYVEALGKGGLWGLGYEYRISQRWGAGAVASYYVLGGDQYATFSPYVSGYVVHGRHHGWFAQLGPQVVHGRVPSPVPEWSGMSSTSVGGELSSGYEYKAGWFVRVFGMVTVGDRVAPWVGASIGWTL